MESRWANKTSFIPRSSYSNSVSLRVETSAGYLSNLNGNHKVSSNPKLIKSLFSREDAGLKDYRMISTLSVDNTGKVYSHVISDMEINSGPQVERNDLFAGVLVGLGVSGVPAQPE